MPPVPHAAEPIRNAKTERRGLRLVPFGFLFLRLAVVLFFCGFLLRARRRPFGPALCAALCNGCALCVDAAEDSAQPLPDLRRGQVKDVQAGAQRQHQHDEVCGRAAAQQQQIAAQQCTQRAAAQPCIDAVPVAGRHHLERRKPLRLNAGKDDHGAAGKHKPQHQLENFRDQVLSPGVLHGKAAHGRAQHKTAAAEQPEQHIVQHPPYRVALHKGQYNEQQPRKQSAKPCRETLFGAFFARRCAARSGFSFFRCHSSRFPVFSKDIISDYIIVPRREENGKLIVVNFRSRRTATAAHPKGRPARR